MNSFFDTLLERYGMSKHDGRPLWKYNLTDEDYETLKETISKANRSSIDPRDLALLYAEWWKNEYKGGFPTKRRVYDVVQGCSINEDEFYLLAKQGAVMLGIKWIQRGKRLFFRTLLLQGGVPVNHMITNSGQYTNFLKKVMELNPDSIDEFAYDTYITKLLPTSSRNEDVYESCLQIVKAIWNGNEEYTAILDAKQGGNNSITKQLREHKSNIENTIRRRASIKAYWILTLDRDEKASVNIKFNLPGIIGSDSLAQILGLNDSNNLQPEYHLLVDDKLLAKLKKNLAGNYKVSLFNNSSYAWSGEQLNPEVRMRDSLGRNHPLPVLSANAPRLDEPSLWVEKSDCEWVLIKGKACKHDEAIVMFPENWSFNAKLSEEPKTIELFQKEMNIVKFSELITFSVPDFEPIEFRTKVSSFEWTVKEEKPDWLLKSNMPVVRDSAQIIVYKEDGSRVNNALLHWRLTGTRNWQPWTLNMPVGCIEYKVAVDGLEEKGHFFNVGNFNLEATETTANHAVFSVINAQDFQFKIEEVDYLSIIHKENSVEIDLTEYSRMPRSIKAKLHKETQARALYFEIAQPFAGIKIIDPDGNVKGSEDILLLGNFNGFRIFAPIQHNYFVRIFNQSKPHIKIIKKLPGGTSPLRQYDEEVYKLIRLTDSMDSSTSVRMEFFESNGFREDKLGDFTVKSFNKEIEYAFDDDKVIVKIKDEGGRKLNLFAIPLECSPGNIELIPLQKEEAGYIFPEGVYLTTKFIVVSDLINDAGFVKPAFVSSNKNNQPTGIYNKQERIAEEAHKLKSRFFYWEKVLNYFKLATQLELPFTTFDVFKAAAKEPVLIARLFCYLSVYADQETFQDNDIKNLEEDLGFCFHWIPALEWSNAINWLRDGLKTNGLEKDDIDKNLFLVQAEIIKMIEGNEPGLVEKDNEKIYVFKEISEFIQNKKVPNFRFNVLNAEINDLRRSLGEKVLNELPQLSPSIPDQFKAILPVDNTNYFVKFLLKVPVSVALSISGKDLNLWNDGENWNEIRRNIQFVQWLTPQWYGLALLHSLNRINNL